MENMKKCISIMALGLLLTACSTTEGVPEGDQLYTGLTKITYENYEPCDHADLMKEEMENSLATAPNGALFGSSRFRFPLPMNLLIWNAYHKSETSFGKWMASSFGKEPVLMSRVNPELRATVARSVLRSHGYFNGNVTHQVVQTKNPKKAKIGYTVNMGHLWTLDSISYLGFPYGCDTLISQTLDNARIHRGDPLDVTTLNEERERISNLLRTNGYFYYQPTYSYYLADTLAVPGKAQLRFQMSDAVPDAARRQWYIGKVNVEFRRRMREQLDSVRQLRNLSIAFNGKRPPIRPRVVLSNLRLRPRQMYSYERHLESIEKVNAMGIYSMVDFQFTPRDSTPECDTLDLKLSCVFEKPYDFYVETRATGSSVGRLGPEVVVGLSKRNALRGGEKFDVSLHGSYAWQLNGGSNNYYEYGFETSLEFPRLVAPFFGGNRPARRSDGTRRRPRRFFSTPTTLVRISNNVINRPGYFNMNTIAAEWTYKWQTSATSRFQFSPLTLQYQFKNRMSDEFNVLRDSLMFINLMMEDKLVPQMRFTYTYSSPANYRNPINWETTISEAGNLTSLGMMAFGKKWNEKNKKLYKTSYSQFLKLETDFTKTWSLDEYSSLVAHLNLGVMYSYGNSYKDTAPFTEYFYVGGASSLRGWPARYIGPGDFTLDFDNRSMRFIRIGTIKAMANLEYRPRLFGNLYGAVFLDAGNVWLHESLLNNTFGNLDDIEATEVPETDPAELDDETVDKVVGFLSSLDHGDIRTSRLGNDFALNTGIGLRYDLGFITLRLDWGLGLHLPYQTGRSGYFNADTFGRDQTLHFAVGMPF